MGSFDFQQISGRNFAEPTGTFPAEIGPESCCKEIVGTQRSRSKTNEIYRIRCRKTMGSDGRNSGSGKIAQGLFFQKRYDFLLDTPLLTKL